MSASLVGSEMCIRDSQSTTAVPCARASASARGAGKRRKAQPTISRARGCLLYTSDAADDM
eukprot:6927170-Alexandrium_andersonii.AAC.1